MTIHLNRRWFLIAGAAGAAAVAMPFTLSAAPAAAYIHFGSYSYFGRNEAGHRKIAGLLKPIIAAKI